MAINFTFDPNQYEEKDFSILPEGNYRVRISEVVEKQFKSGNQGFELTLDVSGKNSKLWAYVIIDQTDPAKTNQRLGDFFKSFHINNFNLAAFNSWVGSVGAVRVKHDEYNGEKTAKVAYFLNPKAQDRLPAWVEPSATNGVTTVNAGFTAVNTLDAPENLPF